MNKTFKVIFSKTRGALVAVNEATKNHIQGFGEDSGGWCLCGITFSASDGGGVYRLLSERSM